MNELYDDRQLVLDTNVLIKGFLEGNADCMCILYSFYLSDLLCLVFDIANKQIESEYKRYMRESEHYIKWYSALFSSNKIVYTNGTLDRKVKSRLLELSFHEESDHCFVAAAVETGKVLITEDSDYGKGDNEKARLKQNVLEYMTVHLGLQVLDYKEGKDFTTRR